MQDRLDAFMIFVAVAEQQSFAKAARRLGRSPASVTRVVAALEEHLQTRLFNRTTRSVALTDAGTRHLESCRRILAAYEELEAGVLGEQAQPRGAINVTAPTMFGRLHVLPPSRAFLMITRRSLSGCCCSTGSSRWWMRGSTSASGSESCRTRRCERSLWGRSGALFVQLRNTLPVTPDLNSALEKV